MTCVLTEIFHPHLKNTSGAAKLLRRLQLAFAGSVAGQYAFAIAIAVYAYRHGGATAVGLMALVRTIPSAVSAPFVSALGDRFRQERVMLVADVLRAFLVGGIAVVVFADGPLVLVFVLAAFGPICGTAFHPAEAALLPTLAATPEELTAANVSTATIDSVGSFVVPALGGLALLIRHLRLPPLGYRGFAEGRPHDVCAD